MKFGVVVVTCNRLVLLKECISAIKNQTEQVSCVVIANNNSTDGTTEFLDNIKDREFIKVLHSKENLGGAGGYYIALEQMAKEAIDWILIIDDDAIIRPNFIEEIKKGIINSESEYLAYSGVVIEDGLPSIFHRKCIMPGDVIGKAVQENRYNEETFECDIASFCGLVIHKSILEKCGLPRKEFFIWHDDTEYCLRIHKESKILNINAAKLDHKRKPGASDDHDWKNYYGLRNALYIYRQYAPEQYYKEQIKLVVRFLKAWRNKDLILRKIYSSVLIANTNKKLGKDDRFLPGKEIK